MGRKMKPEPCIITHTHTHRPVLGNHRLKYEKQSNRASQRVCLTPSVVKNHFKKIYLNIQGTMLGPTAHESSHELENTRTHKR